MYILFIRGELTRCCVPGDIVTISGVFLSVREYGYKAIKSGLQTDTYLKALNIQKSENDTKLLENVELAEIKALALDPDIYHKLANSIGIVFI
jgi:DNA replication licensing factor MCM7